MTRSAASNNALEERHAHITISLAQLYTLGYSQLGICPSVKIDPAWNDGIIPLSAAAQAPRAREYISYSRPPPAPRIVRRCVFIIMPLGRMQPPT